MKIIKDFFQIEELVCRDVHARFGNMAWDFFDPRLLSVLLFIRTNLAKPVTVNNWDDGGQFSQRGFRCNMCDIVRAKKGIYCSAHMRGQAIDFDVKGMTAQEVRTWILNNKERLPYPIRLEDGVTWVHLDVCNSTDEKVKLFRA